MVARQRWNTDGTEVRAKREPRHAEHVRNITAHGWIDAGHALFDLATLPENAITHDLFSERVLVERAAFMEAQTNALAAQQKELLEQGWSAAVTCKHEEVYPLIGGMNPLPREFDAKTSRKLAKVQERREKVEASFEKIADEDTEAINQAQAKLNTLDEAERDLEKRGTVEFSEATKAIGTAFLVLEPDGSVRREYRVARRQGGQAGNNGNGHADDGDHNGQVKAPKPPTSEELNDRQRASAFTHHTLAVREALLDNPLARKRLLVMLLHENVHSEALAIRHDANGVTIHAGREEGFSSPVWDRLRERHTKIDPFADSHTMMDPEAYEKVSKLSAAKLDALIDLLLVEALTAHTAHRPGADLGTGIEGGRAEGVASGRGMAGLLSEVPTGSFAGGTDRVGLRPRHRDPQEVGTGGRAGQALCRCRRRQVGRQETCRPGESMVARESAGANIAG